MPKEHGFTLIELLVTITIISILSLIGLVAYSTVLKNGRDAKRQSDLRQVQAALEQYYADQLYYPSSGSLSFGGSFNNCTGGVTTCTASKTYMTATPKEAVTGRLQYNYAAFKASSVTACDNNTADKCRFYCIYVDLEGTGINAPTGCAYTLTYDFGVSTP